MSQIKDMDHSQREDVSHKSESDTNKNQHKTLEISKISLKNLNSMQEVYEVNEHKNSDTNMLAEDNTKTDTPLSIKKERKTGGSISNTNDILKSMGENEQGSHGNKEEDVPCTKTSQTYFDSHATISTMQIIPYATTSMHYGSLETACGIEAANYAMKNHPLNVRNSSASKRSYLTAVQRNFLNAAFEKNHYPQRDEKMLLADSLALSYKKVHKWFDNRRTKHYRQLRRLGTSVSPESHRYTPMKETSVALHNATNTVYLKERSEARQNANHSVSHQYKKPKTESNSMPFLGFAGDVHNSENSNEFNISTASIMVSSTSCHLTQTHTATEKKVDNDDSNEAALILTQDLYNGIGNDTNSSPNYHFRNRHRFSDFAAVGANTTPVLRSIFSTRDLRLDVSEPCFSQTSVHTSTQNPISPQYTMSGISNTPSLISSEPFALNFPNFNQQMISYASPRYRLLSIHGTPQQPSPNLESTPMTGSLSTPSSAFSSLSPAFGGHSNIYTFHQS